MFSVMFIKFQKYGYTNTYLSFPGGSDSEESASNVGKPSLITGLGISHGEGCGHPLQYSCLKNPMDRGVWRATVHRIANRQEWATFTHSQYIFNSKYKVLTCFDFYCFLGISFPSSVCVCVCVLVWVCLERDREVGWRSNWKFF